MRASVPANIVSKQVLITMLDEQLNFPSYFGGNWDSLEECLRDLSWLPAGQVVLTHADVPLINEVANARTYLAILDGAIGKMSKSDDRTLYVIFPVKFREQIEWLLRSQKREDARRFT